MFVVCDVMFVVCDVMFAICGAMFVICNAMFVICDVMFAICGVTFVICDAMFVICDVMFVICDVMFAICGAMPVMSLHTSEQHLTFRRCCSSARAAIESQMLPTLVCTCAARLPRSFFFAALAGECYSEQHLPPKRSERVIIFQAHIRLPVQPQLATAAQGRGGRVLDEHL